MSKRTPDLLRDWNDTLRESENLLRYGVTRKYSHGYLVKRNSLILPEAGCVCLGYYVKAHRHVKNEGT